MFPLFYLTFSKLNLRNLYLASPYLTQPNFAEVYDVDLPLSYVRRPPLPPPGLLSNKPQSGVSMSLIKVVNFARLIIVIK